MMKKLIAICLVLCMTLSGIGIFVSASEATAEIASIETGTEYVSGEAIFLAANTNVTEWQRIDFYANGEKLPGTVTPSGDPYLLWYAPAAGSYRVHAAVITEAGAQVQSSDVLIAVKASDAETTKELSMTANIPDGAVEVCNELSNFRISFNSALAANQTEKIIVNQGETKMTELSVTQGIDFIDIAFTNANRLSYETTYTITAKGVLNAANRSFGEKTWSFTTISSSCDTAKPIVIQTYPANGAVIGSKARLAANVIFTGNVSKVEMKDGETALGTAQAGTNGEYYLDTELAVGEHSVKTIVTYTNGTTESGAVSFTVKDASYVVKGIADGDRFAMNGADDASQLANIYVIDKTNGGLLKPSSASNFYQAYFYIDGVYAGKSASNSFRLPLTAGEHTLSVLTQSLDHSVVKLGDYRYSALFTMNASNSVFRDFEEGTAGESILSKPNGYNYDLISAQGNSTADTFTYQKSPAGDGMVAALANTASSGGSILSFGGSGWGGIAIPASKLITIDADMYVDSDSNNISFRVTDQGGTLVTESTDLAALKSGSTEKKRWNHISAVLDFESCTYRGFVNDYEVSRGKLKTGINNVMFKIYSNRYGTGTYYFDNISIGAKESVSITTTTYAVKGISDGERIAVSTDANSLVRTISVVNADANGKTVTAATNLLKAEFYIDNVLRATVSQNPCQWKLPLTDLKTHTFQVITTDAAGGKQTFGPYSYTAVYMEDNSDSFVESFEGTSGESITKDSFTDTSKIANFTSTQNSVYAAASGRSGTAMKLSGNGSSASTTLQTKQSIVVPANGVVTVDMDIYCETVSDYHKLTLRLYNSDGYRMNNTSNDILTGLMTSVFTAKEWHRISFVYDIASTSYKAFIDGYEFERGSTHASIANRLIQFHLADQSWDNSVIYIDNLAVCAKKAMTDKVTAQTLTEGKEKSSVVINNTDAEKSFQVFSAEYDENRNLVSVHTKEVTLEAQGIWRQNKGTISENGNIIEVYLWDSQLKPMTPSR